MTKPLSRVNERSHQPRNFLSGEGDKDLRLRRQKRLDELAAVCSPPTSNFGNDLPTSTAERRVCIEVVGETKCEENENTGDGRGESSDDDEPPPISSKLETIRVPDPKSQPAVSQTEQKGCDGNSTDPVDSPSLMEEMIAEAAKARDVKAKRSNQKQRKDAKSASFGMKKGFLNPGTKVKKKNPNKTTAGSSAGVRTGSNKEKGGKRGFQRGFLHDSHVELSSRNGSGDYPKTESNNDDIFELDSDGNLVKASLPLTEEIPTIRPKDRHNQSGGRDSLRFEEVQEAMKNNPAEKLAGSEWVTESLMQKVAQNPRLATGLSNPKFTAALQALRKNPREAIAKFKNQPEIADFLHEFCGVMGEHFTMLGKEHDKKVVTQDAPRADAATKIGPLAQEAVRKQAEKGSKGGSLTDSDMSREEREKMNTILADKELTSILMDPDIQRVMQECALPGRMQAYMNHPIYDEKLRKLISAGLLKVEC